MSGEGEREVAEALIERWRMRLHDLSWYMRCLNEHLARRANIEDECNGSFWQGRFKSQALLDECGLLTAMVYVDLNPIRAGIAASPEDSEFTSIYERIRELRGKTTEDEGVERGAKAPLLPFRTPGADKTIPYRLDGYLELVDWTGRQVRKDKCGAIDDQLPPILVRLNIDADAWRLAMRPRGNVFGRALGRLDRMQLHAKTLGQSWIRGLRAAERAFG